jgi:hypothetical protein
MKTFQFFIPGPLPGMNDIINDSRKLQHWRLRSGTAQRRSRWDESRKQWIELISSHIKLEGGSLLHTFDRAHFEFTWIEANKRRDPDNIAAAKKLLFDGMIVAGLIENDGWKQVASFKDTFEICGAGEFPGVRVLVISA